MAAHTHNGIPYQERMDHGFSPFYLVIYGEPINTSKTPVQRDGETIDAFLARYDKWVLTSTGTAQFVNYLEHRSNNRLAKLDFVADFLEQY